MSASFRLLPKHALMLISVPESLAASLAAEGYDLAVTTTAEIGWRWTLRHVFTRRKWHFLVASPLPPVHERALRRLLRFCPWLVASWTRLDAEAWTVMEARLIKLAEQDYNGTSTQGRQHDGTPALHAGSPARTRSEFDHLLKTSHS